jgi:hypothetical protein
VVSENEHILVTGGDRDDGDQLLMNLYHSERGGISSVLAVIGALARSGKVTVRSVKLACDNEAAIKVCKRTRKHHSVFHRKEGDHNLSSTIRYLQESWCQDTEIQYEWVKGHADDLHREVTKRERMNIVADELFNVTRETVRGAYGARCNCGL